MPKVVEWRVTKQKGGVNVIIERIEVSKSKHDGKWIFKNTNRRRGRARGREQSEIKLFFPDLSLFGRHQINVRANGKLHRRLLRNCPPDTYKYAAYVVKWRTFAVGHSSPIIVVRP